MRNAKSALMLAAFCVIIAALSQLAGARVPPQPNGNPVTSDNSPRDSGRDAVRRALFMPQPELLRSALASSPQVSAATPIILGTSREAPRMDEKSRRMYLPLLRKRSCTGDLWEIEPNNHQQQATGPLSSGQQCCGYPNDLDDYFSIDVPISGPITVDLSDHARQGVQLQLYYELVSLETLVAATTEWPYHIEHSGKAGRYYIRVWTSAEEQTRARPYTLKTTFPILTATPTSTVSSTPTMTATPTSTGTATSTPTVTDTPGPAPSWCRSFRPPLSDSGHPGHFEILTPGNCASDLGHRLPIGGTYNGISEEEEQELEVWVLVYAPNNWYYPQSSDQCAGKPADFGGGLWNELVNLAEKGVPESGTFDIVVVVTTKGSQASIRFAEYLTSGCSSGIWKGIVDCDMPTDLTEKASITVRADAATPTMTPTSGPTPSWCRSFRPQLWDSGHPGEFEIFTPMDCADDLPHRVVSAGTYTGISSDDERNLEVWVLAYPEDLKYYPQSSDCDKECPAGFGGGVWIVTAYLGREGVPETFDMVVVVTRTGSEASTRFKQYLRNGCTNDYEGIPRSQMPTDLTEKASIRVRTGYR